MRIQSRLLLSILASVAISLIIASVAFFTLQDVKRDLVRNQAYDEIIFKATSMNILLAGLRRGEFPSDLKQLLETSASLEQLLNTVVGSDLEEELLISHIRRDSEDFSKLLRSALINTQGEQFQLTPGSKPLIESQLWMKVRRIADECSRLRLVSRDRIIAAQNKAGLTIILLLLALIVSNTVISVVSGKAILRSEESLRESETRYRTIFKDAHDGMAVTDMETGLLTNCNNALCSLVRRQRREIIGQAPTILHPALELLREADPESQGSKKPVFGIAIDSELLSNEGKVIPVDILSSEFQMDSRSYLLSVFRDITRRKKVETELLESEKKYRALVENSSESILVLQSGKAKFFNRRARALFGSEIEKLQAGNLVDLAHPDDQNRLSAYLEGSESRSTGLGDLTFRLVLASGRILWIELGISDIEWEDQPARLFFMKDISETHRLQEQLQQAQKLESIGSLAGGVAHDFNNMLTIILGYGEAVANRMDKNDPNREFMTEIVKAGERSAALTRQLLAFSRRQALQPKVISLNRVILDLEKMLRRLIGEDIQLKLLLSEDLDKVLADPGQMEQVIINLAVNARDAMPYGGSLLIETSNITLDQSYASRHTSVEPGQYVSLVITDTGTGMTKEILDQIFDPFFTTKEKGRGTGLGLSTVYGIVKQSGGIIWAYSEPGEGTTMKIYLPQTDAAQDQTQRNLRTLKGTSGNEHILVVEDEESLRELIKALLLSLKYKVTIAGDGVEALKLIEDEGVIPDLIITDVIMPRMSGTDMIARVKAIHPKMRTLYMSGYTDNAAIEHGILKLGMPFIQKPFNLRDFADKVHELLSCEITTPSE